MNVKNMFRTVLLVLSVFVFSVISFVPTLATVDPCDKHWFYADTQIGWCIPDGWTSWSLEAGNTDADLSTYLKDMYNVSRDDIYEVGLPLVAMLMHPTYKKYAVYAQLYVSDYPSEAGSPENVINGLYITSNDGSRSAFTVNNDDGRVKGLLYKQYDGYGRAWVLYPIQELGKVYMVTAFAPTAAWGANTDIRRDLDNISLRLYVTDKPSPNVNQGDVSQGNPGSNKVVTVFNGARITTVDYSTKTVQDTKTGSTVEESDAIHSTFPAAIWEFRKDGTVTFTPLGVGSKFRDDLYPVTGTYKVINPSVDGGVIVFTLYRESIVGGNKSYVSINGTVNNLTGEADIYYQVSSGLVAVTSQGKRTQVVTVNAHFAEILSR